MWRKLYFQNEKFEAGIQNCLRSNLTFINPGTGLIEVNQNASMDFNTNWLFFGHTTSLRDCFLWHSVMFNNFDLVPEYCKLRCYKVVVKVRNFLEAMQFYNAILAGPIICGDLMPIHGKVGVDERFYSDGHFNGFVYCDGLEDALERYATVRKIVDEQIPNGKDINIIIKRTCTEFERKYGSTNQEFWQSMSEDELDLQHRIEDIFGTRKVSVTQPDWLKNKIITKMVKWANTCGDKSWIDFFDIDDFITMKAVTYHEGKPKENAMIDAGPTKKPKTKSVKRR